VRNNYAAKVTAATSDNGLNMVNGLQGAGFQYVFGCVAHTVHLSVDKRLKAARMSCVLAKARRVVEHFSKSSKSTYQLCKVQVNAGKSEQEVLVLVQDVPTRWTATYFMLKRLTDLGKFVHRVLADRYKRCRQPLAQNDSVIASVRAKYGRPGVFGRKRKVTNVVGENTPSSSAKAKRFKVIDFVVG